MANRYASHQLKASFLRASVDLVVACAPMTSLVTGLGLGAAGYLLDAPGVAAGGAVVAAGGLYVERMQARALRRRRRYERMRNRNEVTELRRTIAQLRLDVDAFQRALLDTEAALAARSLPRLPVPEPVAEPVIERIAEPVAEPVAQPLAGVLDEPLIVDLDEPVHAWVQTADRDARADGDPGELPAQQPSPFVAAASSSLPVLPELPPRRTFDTGGIPVLDPAPSDRLTAVTDALVYAALTGIDDDERTRRLAYAEAGHGVDEADRKSA